MSSDARSTFASLRPVGPAEMLDRAVRLVRHGPSRIAARAWLGGSGLAAAAIGTYYIELIEGVRDMRPLLAMGLVLAWWARGVALARASRDAVEAIWRGGERVEGAGRVVDVVRTASVVGLGLWLWLWVPVVASFVSGVAVAFVVPLFAVRGAVAPSWPARAGCTTDGGFRAWFRAVADASGRRGSGLLLELMVLLGALALFVNLLLALGFVLLIGRSFFGMDLALLQAFLSPQNTFAVLCVAAVTVVLLEPLRAAIAAVSYVDARVRQDGLDLKASVDEALAATADPRKRAPSSAAAGRGVGESVAAVLLALAVAGGAAEAVAQPTPQRPPAVAEESPGEGSARLESRDERVQLEVERIVARPEFREFSDERGRSIREAIEHFFEWLFREVLDLPDLPEADPGGGLPRVPLPPPQVFLLIGLALVVAVTVYLLTSRLRDRREEQRKAAAGGRRPDPRERPPAAHLDEAAVLAEQGRFRDALRSLYLATLVALDRQRLISFDPALTNWQYIRQMPRGQPRRLFGAFTRMFDYKWYGDEPTTHDDYERVRGLADLICEPSHSETPDGESQ